MRSRSLVLPSTRDEPIPVGMPFVDAAKQSVPGRGGFWSTRVGSQRSYLASLNIFGHQLFLVIILLIIIFGLCFVHFGPPFF